MTPEAALDFARDVSEGGLENDCDAALCVLANEVERLQKRNEKLEWYCTARCECIHSQFAEAFPEERIP